MSNGESRRIEVLTTRKGRRETHTREKERTLDSAHELENCQVPPKNNSNTGEETVKRKKRRGKKGEAIEPTASQGSVLKMCCVSEVASCVYVFVCVGVRCDVCGGDTRRDIIIQFRRPQGALLTEAKVRKRGDAEESRQGSEQREGVQSTHTCQPAEREGRLENSAQLQKVSSANGIGIRRGNDLLFLCQSQQ